MSDIARDPNRNVLYFADSGVYSYDLVTRQVDLSNRILYVGSQIDISPDGNHLVSAANAYSSDRPNDIWVSVYDFVTASSRDYVFKRSSAYEGGAYDAVFADDHTLLVTTTYLGSGYRPVPLRKIDINTGDVTVIAQVQQNTALEPSGDRRIVGLAEDDSSDGPFAYFDVSSQTLHEGGTAGIYDSQIAPNRSGTQFAVPTIFGVGVYDRSFRNLLSVPAQYPTRYPVDVLYSPVSDVLYVTWTGEYSYLNTPDRLIAYDAKTLKVLETLDALTFGSFSSLSISRDGRELYAAMFGPYGSKWVNVYDVSKYAVPEPSTAMLLTTFFGLLGTSGLRQRNSLRRTKDRLA